METSICTTVFFCTLVICITTYFVQKLKRKNEREFYEMKSQLTSELEFEKKMKTLYKNLSAEMGLDKIQQSIFDVKQLLLEDKLHKQKEKNKQ